VAGIGFELRKAISKGGLSSFLKAAFSGMMIVAGPWLLSIIGITAIQRLMGFAVSEAPDHFMGVIIYSYAWSLFFFGGIQFLYTRIMADMLFVREERKAAGALVFFLVPTLLLTALISSVAVNFIAAPVRFPLLFSLSSIVLFVSINAIWLFMIFISLLKWYGRILLIYATGMTLSLLAIYVLGRELGAAGALAGYALGQFCIAALLAILSFIAHKPTEVWSNAKRFVEYVKKFTPLLITGIIYYWGIWIDKIVFWLVRGETVPGTFIRLFGSFDIAVYLANLSMIPGLVFFIVSSETAFYIELRRFLVSLGKGTYATIQKRKLAVLTEAKRGVAGQSVFQGVITITLILLAPVISAFFELELATFRIILLGVYMHLMFLTLLNFNFYLEFFRHALVGSVLFFTVNLLGALTSLRIFPSLAPGVSYLAACIVASIYVTAGLFVSGRRIDRIILSRA
jgi:polysaccharide biosynthesis protein PelG